MALPSGTKLGPYEIVSPLGVGGMGEVYRARDSKLGRDVALKVIAPEFAHDQQRMGRFQREAQVLASLNHPHIASIYGFEDSSGVSALVMELVEGPTLAERIHQGAIPLDEALPIARQIAEALECAHERGIVHRDLKPANIKLTNDGKVKVLDFGLAKALQDDTSGTDISNSPTLTMGSTKAGIILGTAAYMSPEQAKGKSADRRADIWSFGVVLYEMLTGEQAFGGETVSDSLASVIKDAPDFSKLPAQTPPRVRELLQRCLQKDPKQRLQSHRRRAHNDRRSASRIEVRLVRLGFCRGTRFRHWARSGASSVTSAHAAASRNNSPSPLARCRRSRYRPRSCALRSLSRVSLRRRTQRRTRATSAA
jgi:eukaryotic-like serine/threonine-protein kinase